MKVLNLIILLQQLENYKNFQYNNHMKSKEEIYKLAKQIVQLEQKIQANSLDKTNQIYMSKIENIMEELSINQLIELNETVEKIIN